MSACVRARMCVNGMLIISAIFGCRKSHNRRRNQKSVKHVHVCWACLVGAMSLTLPIGKSL